MHQFELIGVNCGNSHFVVIHVGFDDRNPEVLVKVAIYDFLQRTGRQCDQRSGRQCECQLCWCKFSSSASIIFVTFVINGMLTVETLTNQPDFIIGTLNSNRVHNKKLVQIVNFLHLQLR